MFDLSGFVTSNVRKNDSFHESPPNPKNNCRFLLLCVLVGNTHSYQKPSRLRTQSSPGYVVDHVCTTSERAPNMVKKNSIVFSQTHRFTGKCWLAPCVLPHGSTKRTHPDRSDACTYFGKIELFSADFALSHIGKKSDFFQKPSAGARKNLPPT